MASSRVGRAARARRRVRWGAVVVAVLAGWLAPLVPASAASSAAITVTPTSPTFIEDVCSKGSPVGASYTIPSVTGVDYFVDAVSKTAGKYAATDGSTIVVTTMAQSGFLLTGVQTFIHTFAKAPDCTIVVNPRLTAFVTSAFARTRAGWFRAPIHLRFTCKVGSASLVAACPGPFTIYRSSLSHSVRRTITATDGGSSTVKILLKLDRVRPTVHLLGVTKGKVYAAGGPSHLRCTAADRLSGLAAPCHLRKTRHGQQVTVVARARDRAGNVATVSSSYRLQP